MAMRLFVVYCFAKSLIWRCLGYDVSSLLGSFWLSRSSRWPVHITEYDYLLYWGAVPADVSVVSAMLIILHDLRVAAIKAFCVFENFMLYCRYQKLKDKKPHRRASRPMTKGDSDPGRVRTVMVLCTSGIAHNHRHFYVLIFGKGCQSIALLEVFDTRKRAI